ncbi:unnamed protein product, partial [Nesidiocoris tenuis]
MFKESVIITKDVRLGSKFVNTLNSLESLGHRVQSLPQKDATLHQITIFSNTIVQVFRIKSGYLHKTKFHRRGRRTFWSYTLLTPTRLFEARFLVVTLLI